MLFTVFKYLFSLHFEFLQLDSTRGAPLYELNNFCYHGNILGSRLVQVWGKGLELV